MSAPDVRAQAADLIDAAIDVLHERGWCQGRYEDRAGRVCMEGAVYTAARGGSTFLAVEALNSAVGGGLWWFNDNVAESVEDVLLTMKRVAASLREPQP